MAELNTEDKALLHSQLKALKNSLTGDLMSDMSIMDEVLKIEITLGITKPNTEGNAECVGCGS